MAQVSKRMVQGTMQKRILLTEQSVGKKVVLTIQGNGNIVDVKDRNGDFVPSAQNPEMVLQKKIFNCRAASAVAMSNSRTHQLLLDGLAADKAGDLDAASEHFNDYLNKTQVSFGVLLPNTKADKLSDGVEISAKVELIETENGKVLTIDPSTIAIVEPERLGSVKFDISAFESEEAEEEQEAPKAKKATTAKNALKA